jgi:hypothetical protein
MDEHLEITMAGADRRQVRLAERMVPLPPSMGMAGTIKVFTVEQTVNGETWGEVYHGNWMISAQEVAKAANSFDMVDEQGNYIGMEADNGHLLVTRNHQAKLIAKEEVREDDEPYRFKGNQGRMIMKRTREPRKQGEIRPKKYNFRDHTLRADTMSSIAADRLDRLERRTKKKTGDSLADAISEMAKEEKGKK